MSVDVCFAFLCICPDFSSKKVFLHAGQFSVFSEKFLFLNSFLFLFLWYWAWNPRSRTLSLLGKCSTLFVCILFLTRVSLTLPGPASNSPCSCVAGITGVVTTPKAAVFPFPWLEMEPREAWHTRGERFTTGATPQLCAEKEKRSILMEKLALGTETQCMGLGCGSEVKPHALPARGPGFESQHHRKPDQPRPLATPRFHDPWPAGSAHLSLPLVAPLSSEGPWPVDFSQRMQPP